MASIYDKYAVGHEIEQKTQKTVAAADAVASPVIEEKRTTLSLSLTVSDKKALKMMAAERETTIAAIIHEWVQEYIKEVDE